MTKEEHVKMLISDSGHSLKSFAESIGLPYTTLLGMLKNGLGGASVQNVIRVCKGIGITIEQLQEFDNDDREITNSFVLNADEKNIISQYRQLPETTKEDIRDYIEMKYTKATIAATQEELA